MVIWLFWLKKKKQAEARLTQDNLVKKGVLRRHSTYFPAEVHLWWLWKGTILNIVNQTIGRSINYLTTNVSFKQHLKEDKDSRKI